MGERAGGPHQGRNTQGYGNRQGLGCKPDPKAVPRPHDQGLDFRRSTSLDEKRRQAAAAQSVQPIVEEGPGRRVRREGPAAPTRREEHQNQPEEDLSPRWRPVHIQPAAQRTKDLSRPTKISEEHFWCAVQPPTKGPHAADKSETEPEWRSAHGVNRRRLQTTSRISRAEGLLLRLPLFRDLNYNFTFAKLN